ncbi:MAG: hypothetical protein ACYC1E_17965 [Propionibacteriaceae bacterium]
MITLDPAQHSLLRVAQTLHAAADLARAAAHADPGGHDTEFGVLTLLGLAASLLPLDLPLTKDAVPSGHVRALLEDAEAELRRFPIASYPEGTVDLVVGLCDLIRRTQGERL